MKSNAITVPSSSSPSSEDLEILVTQLKAEKHQLLSVIEDLPGSIYWKNKKGVYLGRNKTSGESMKRFGFSWKPEDILGKTDYNLFPKNMADGFRAHDIAVMESGQESTQEERATLPNGETVIQLSTKRPLYDEQGNVVGVVGNTVDITYLKKIETELKDAKEKSEQANSVKREFIRHMEHDIRTPFNGVWGVAEYLQKTETDPYKKELLTDIANCAKELLDYCNGILDFSKIESGALPFLEKKFNILKVVGSIMKIEAPPAKSKNLRLSLDYDDNIPKILIGDQYRLQRTLINIISNATKFTQQGSIKFIVKLINIKNNTVIIRFIVEDTGIGIPQEKQDFIFEKFARLVPANKNIYKGIGLGLRIVKQFIEEMNGEIDLKSEQNKGSTFTCTIPFRIPLVSDMIDEEITQ